MTVGEFTPEMLRLHRGFGVENQLTPDRLSALFESLGHYAPGALREGVSRALRESRMPGFEALHGFIDEAAEDDRRLENRRADDDAKRFFAEPPKPMKNVEWARAHHRAINLMIDGKRDEARAILRAIGSPANIDIMVPIDKGEWLRANGIEFRLWPPNFCDAEGLEWMGWPWPEWPKSRAMLNAMDRAAPFPTPPPDERSFAAPEAP